MKKYTYVPTKIKKRPIYVGGQKLFGEKVIVEKRPAQKKLENALKPFTLKDKNIVTINGGGNSSPIPPPPVGSLWNETTSTWDTTSETWNNI